MHRVSDPASRGIPHLDRERSTPACGGYTRDTRKQPEQTIELRQVGNLDGELHVGVGITRTGVRRHDVHPFTRQRVRDIA